MPTRSASDPSREERANLKSDGCHDHFAWARGFTGYVYVDLLLVAGFWRCRSWENVTDQSMTLNRRVYVMMP